jgi:hypothetical protein
LKAEDDCVHTHPIPAEEIGRYSVTRDPDAERDIENYVRGQARDETVQHVEKVKTEYIMGDPYTVWDVTTDKDRWWVITNLTNLYSQRHFPSLDYTLSFHIGLMMRLRSSPEGADADNPDPFDQVFRRQEQAKDRHDRAVEAEDYQAVGMQLRECLITLIAAMKRRVELPVGVDRPKEADFVGWSGALMNQLCGGEAARLHERLNFFLHRRVLHVMRTNALVLFGAVVAPFKIPNNVPSGRKSCAL